MKIELMFLRSEATLQVLLQFYLSICNEHTFKPPSFFLPYLTFCVVEQECSIH